MPAIHPRSVWIALLASGALAISCPAQSKEEKPKEEPTKTEPSKEEKKPEEHHLKFDLDPVMALAGLWDLTTKTIEDRCPAEGFNSSPFFHWVGRTEDAKDRAVFDRKPFSNVTVDLTIFGGKVPVEEAIFDMKDGKVVLVRVTICGETASEETTAEIVGQHTEACKGALTTLLGSPSEPQSRMCGVKAAMKMKTLTWKGVSAVAALDSSSADRLLEFSLAPATTEMTALLAVPLRSARGADEFFVNLDPLLALPALWLLTPEKMEAAFGGSLYNELPFFRWLTSDKGGVRFSKRPYGNVTVDLSLFHGAVPVDEVVIEFAGGKASSATVSLYNRGDGGEIARAEFDRRYKSAGVSLGKLLGVRASERKPNAQMAVKTHGWLWAAPHTLALLEYNEEALKEPAKPEFLRLRLAPPADKDKLLNIAAIGQTTTTVSRSDLPKFVKRETNGDVYVSGIPMVDQGDKGYCVVASCQRMFGYLHIPCDQHEIALIAGSDSQRGTSSTGFVAALDKIDNRFKVRFKPLLEKMPMEPSAEREARPDRFLKMIQDEVDKGVPLLWALELGQFPEEPDNGAQEGGAHMRLIIGYNTKTGQLLFSDSWGAGHELKRMKLEDAVKATFGVYRLEPRAR